ncbi:unnamed protein product [Darwinula stevensoni]|uniref:Uncharacterized protein n=1 Tax=Darwinula stevensoni TaxID=69355 RepID=A0A7R9FPM8_9CRUS|nr:unnamed protein product [Darwinula stevensoni]CAG0898158.1 unnamed protein product [Darwinula stevensoni]
MIVREISPLSRGPSRGPPIFATLLLSPAASSRDLAGFKRTTIFAGLPLAPGIIREISPPSRGHSRGPSGGPPIPCNKVFFN